MKEQALTPFHRQDGRKEGGPRADTGASLSILALRDFKAAIQLERDYRLRHLSAMPLKPLKGDASQYPEKSRRAEEGIHTIEGLGGGW